MLAKQLEGSSSPQHNRGNFPALWHLRWVQTADLNINAFPAKASFLAHCKETLLQVSKYWLARVRLRGYFNQFGQKTIILEFYNFKKLTRQSWSSLAPQQGQWMMVGLNEDTILDHSPFPSALRVKHLVWVDSKSFVLKICQPVQGSHSHQRKGS